MCSIHAQLRILAKKVGCTYGAQLFVFRRLYVWSADTLFLVVLFRRPSRTVVMPPQHKSTYHGCRARDW